MKKYKIYFLLGRKVLGACGSGADDDSSSTDSDGQEDAGETGGSNGDGLSTGGAAPSSGGAHQTETGGAAATGGVDGSPTGGSGTGGSGTGGSGEGGSGKELTEEQAMCERWNADRADMSESGWTGSTASCTAGDMSASSRENALRLVNLARWMADLPAVTTSAQYNQDDQQCALMMHAQNSLSHSPGTSWACYTADGAEAASRSCIAGAGAVRAVPLYLVDPGNATTLGHRRWILSNRLGPIGIGSTGSYSCMWTGTSENAGKAWTAWPPPGPFPIEAATDGWNRTLDETGLSVQSDTINLAGASVSVTAGGNPLPVTVTQLQSGYGSTYAISFIPSGWKLTVGTTYDISITEISSPINYQVTVVACE